MHAHFSEWGTPVPHGKLPPFRFWCQKTLPTLYDDSLSYYEVLSNVTWYINQLINVCKVYDDKFCELMGVYKQLEHYVNCYFDNLNVPQTIADILDDMAYNGRLTEILVEYLKNYSIDARKIKGGIVVIHYEYDETVGGVEHFVRVEDDKDVVDILRHGSVIMGAFNGSPTHGNYFAMMDSATYVYEQVEHQCAGGCACKYITCESDFTILFDEVVIETSETWELNGSPASFVKRRLITDKKENPVTVEYLPLVADIADNYVTHDKMAPNAIWSENIKDDNVTEPKLSPDVRHKLNVTYSLSKTGNTITLSDSDGNTSSVDDDNVTYTISKSGDTVTLTGSDGSSDSFVDDNTTYTLTGNGDSLVLTGSDGSTNRVDFPTKYIFIGDDYDVANGGWIVNTATKLGLDTNDYVRSSANGAGFVGSGTTYLDRLQAVTTGSTEAQRNKVKYIVIAGGYNDRNQNIDSAAAAFNTYVKTNYPYAKVYLAQIAWKCNALATGHKYDTGYLPLTEKYIKVAGDNGWAFMDNLQYAMHDYSLFDATGLKPSANGNAEIARGIATTLRGGTYNVHHVGRMVTVTPDSAINLQPTSQQNLFPGDTNTGTTSFMQLIDNGTIYCRLDNFWCIEFKNPTNLIGHGPAGTGGRIGTFDIMTFNVAEGFFEGAEFYGGKPFPCSVVDSSGNVTNAEIYISFIDNKVRANLYKAKETQTAQSIGIEFEDFDNVKFIHWGTPPPSWVYDAYMC